MNKVNPKQVQILNVSLVLNKAVLPKNHVNDGLFCFYRKCFERLFFHKNNT